MLGVLCLTSLLNTGYWVTLTIFVPYLNNEVIGKEKDRRKQ